MKYKLLQLFPIFILSACATTKTTSILFSPVTVPPDSAIVYVYNPHAEENAYILKFFVNGKEKFDLPDNSYGYVNLPPGEHILRFHVVGTGATPGEANISVSAGKEYYVRAEPTTPDFSGTGGSLFGAILVMQALSNIEIDIRSVDKGSARREISRTTLALGVPDLDVAISASSSTEQAINSDHVVNLVTPTPEATPAESISAVESISGADINPDSELDLRALVSGATRSGVSSKGWRFHVYAAPDGQMFVRTETNKKKVLNATGTWEINQSNQLCENFNDIPQGHCLTVTPLGGDRYMTQATEPSSRIEVAFSKGDTQGLDARPASALSTVGKAALPKSGENSADSDSELHALISGATWSGKTKKGSKFIVYAAPDGELFGRSTSRRGVETWDRGMWEANKSGQVCRRWDTWFDRTWGCIDVIPLGGSRYMMRAEGDSEGTDVDLVKGDPQSLDTRPASALSTVGKTALPKSGENSAEGVSKATDVDLVKGDPQRLDARPASALSTVDIAALPKSAENSTDSDNELHALISHATWLGKTRKGVNFIVYAAPDGELFGRSTNRFGVERWDRGMWEMNRSGQLCRRWDKQFGYGAAQRDDPTSTSGCMDVRPLGGNRYMMLTEGDSEGTEVVILKGDTNRLDTRVTRPEPTDMVEKPQATRAITSATASTLEPVKSNSGNTEISTSSIGYSTGDISGIYRSDITSNHASYFVTGDQRQLVLDLQHNGNVITGTDRLVGSEINGTVEGNIIELTFRSRKIKNGAKIKIAWEVVDDGQSLRGTWKISRTGQYGGIWNLTRIE